MANDYQEEIALKSEELRLKKDEFELKKSEFNFKQVEAASLRQFETWKTKLSAGSVVVAAVALAIPIVIALLEARNERILADQQARLTAQMKVADLALLNARNASEVKERAHAFASLFSSSQLLPKGFAEGFDPKKFKLDRGRSVDTRERMVTLLAQYPNQREQILKDWYVLFEWDQGWLDHVLVVSNDEKEKLKARSKQVEDYFKSLNP
jgi:hypothetical protein